QAAALIDARARRSGVTVKVDGPESLSLAADGNLIKQVVLNVMMNALQAMPDGGTLSIAVERVGGAAEIRVADSGCGIAVEDRERIFDPFFTTKKEGTGLGLSVCYGIVQRHGGEIEVDSEIGVGSTVRIRLPGRHA
ncbi:MAG: ATP-binding protein, partial [Gemmatimonadales bacterium]